MTVKRILKGFTASLLTVGLAAGLTACGNNSSGGNKNNPNNGGNAQLTFSLKGATTLLTQEDIVQASSAAGLVQSASGRNLFSYEIASPGLVQAAAASGDAVGTNLLAVAADGSARLALDSNQPVKVMYSVTDPAAEYVYLALDTGWWGNWDGNDYAQVIAQLDCALLKVSLQDDSWSCAAPGLLVQDMNDQYRQAISGDQKPLQFDEAGNLYFAGTPFQTECNGDGAHRWCGLHQEQWRPQIFQVNTAGKLTTISQDNQYIEFFLVLPSGEVVFNSWTDGSWVSRLSLRNTNGQIIHLSNESWGVSFFSVDTGNTVMWSDWSSSSDGIRFARPNQETGGVQWATLSTKLFQSYDGSGYTNPTPRRLIVADDGRLYGVFESYSWDQPTQKNVYTLRVHQVLPYDAVPRVTLELGDGDWWNWMERTPFAVAKGFLYYTESVDPSDGFGKRDVIRMVRLSDRSSSTLLDDARYTIYNWRLTGDGLFFSGLDMQTNVVITGEIDTLKVAQGADDFLRITENASAMGAASAIRDIEVLRPRAPDYEAGSPLVQRFHADAENIYSVSLDFNKFMNRGTVESMLDFRDDNSNAEIAAMPVWIHKSLHLIPDLDLTGLNDSTGTKPLQFDTPYQITLPLSGVFDASGFPLAESFSGEFRTRPSTGWYLGTSEAPTALSSGTVAKWAQPVDANGHPRWQETLYRVGEALESDFTLEFSSRNRGWEGISVLVWDENRSSAKRVFQLQLNGWSTLQYRNTTNASRYQSADTPGVFNGQWQRYQVRMTGSELAVSTSSDGTNWSKLDSLSVTDLRTGGRLQLGLIVREPVEMDDLALTIGGTTTTEPFNLRPAEFDAPFAMPSNL